MLFVDVTKQSTVKHLATENEYIDYKQEPLLPKRFSQLGPCITVADFNKDGLEDFL